MRGHWFHRRRFGSIAGIRREYVLIPWHSNRGGQSKAKQETISFPKPQRIYRISNAAQYGSKPTSRWNPIADVRVRTVFQGSPVSRRRGKGFSNEPAVSICSERLHQKQQQDRLNSQHYGKRTSGRFGEKVAEKIPCIGFGKKDPNRDWVPQFREEKKERCKRRRPVKDHAESALGF